MSLRTPIAALVALSLVLPAAAAVAKERPADAVAGLLLAYEYAPGRAAIEAVAPDPTATLVAIHGDAARLRVVRLRALDALGHFPTIEVRGYLHRIATSEAADALERHHAATALVFGWRDGAISSVGPLLSGPDASLATTVAEALVAHGGPAGLRLVRRVAAHHKRPEVRAAMEAMLRPPSSGPSVEVR